jgi:molecular chaperone HscB
MVDPFEALGIEPRFDLDLAAVERRVRAVLGAVHPDRHASQGATDRRLALGKAVDVNEAWRIVRDPIRRAEALLRRRGVAVAEGREPKAAPAFLMEMMELREALAEARAKRDAERVASLSSAVSAREAEALRALSLAMDAPSASAESLLALLGQLRYFRRFLDEVSAIEDDLAGLPPPGATA